MKTGHTRGENNHHSPVTTILYTHTCTYRGPPLYPAPGRALGRGHRGTQAAPAQTQGVHLWRRQASGRRWHLDVLAGGGGGGGDGKEEEKPGEEA